MAGHVARTSVCIRACAGQRCRHTGMSRRRIAPVSARQHAHTHGKKKYTRRDSPPRHLTDGEWGFCVMSQQEPPDRWSGSFFF